jgi:glycerol-1-phosphatase
VAEPGALAAAFGGVVLDLDGVVYVGDQAVPAAPAALEELRGLGVRLAFVTNNSYRPPGQVVERLGRLGVKAAPEEVLTSAQAAVRLLGGGQGLDRKAVLVLGGPGLRQALEAAGARLVDTEQWRQAEVVVVGFDPDLTYGRVKAAALAIRAGARFVGSNPDPTLPAPDGLWPGAGATLAMLQAATGVRPEVAGKPEPALFETAAAAIGPGPYLMVGDRADTDLDGAQRLGWATALVLSGVARPADLPDLAVVPDHLLADVGGLLDPPGPAIRPAGRDSQAGPDGRDSGPGAQDSGPGGQPSSRGGQGDGPNGPGGQRDGPGGQGGRGEGTLVGVDGERVVGTVAWRRRGTLAQLDGPAVEEGWRGRLLGTRLVVAACVQARAGGARRILAPDGAEAFFQRLGFRRSGPDGRLLRDLPAAGGGQR